VHESSREAFSAALDGDTHEVDEVLLVHADGRPRWFEIIVTDLRDDPDIQGRVVTAREIGRRKRVELQLARSEARFRSLVQHSSDIVAVLDDRLQFQWVSPSIEPVLGYQPSSLIDAELSSLVEAASKLELARVLYRLEISDGEPQQAEIRIMTNYGELKTLDATITDLRGEPAVAGLVLNANDITERKLLEDQLRHQALHDDLTGMPNRLLFRDRLEQSLNRRVDGQMAVVMVDLDEFKSVNDGLGHECGDELLKVIAFRLRQFLRRGDTAARLGGDEFGIVVDEVQSRSDVLDVVDRLRAVINEPILLDGREVRSTASVGLAFSEDVPDATAESMMRSVDTAMYAAKNQGKDRVAVFDSTVHAGVFERLELRSDLAGAVERQEFRLFYQPIVDLSSRDVVGFEALLRWQHPERGMVSPATFIPLAEESGLIVPIGEWLVHEALTQLRDWQRTIDSAFTMSINLSPRQLQDPMLVEQIHEALIASGVEPMTVGFELTESMSVDDEVLTQRLFGIRQLGVSLYADDFGTGYASYASLQRHPFTTVKIDRSIIEGLDEPDNTRALAQVKSIIDMAHGGGMNVVAEGIETASQADMLTSVGCDRGQGYYFARPASPADLELGTPAAHASHTPH
ncbi:MAG: EAL domain-containing protein, partial [Acidimicrobiales bacterium]|nr:EAL domain-containing protein [Acidimicrobiales bacterium]